MEREVGNLEGKVDLILRTVENTERRVTTIEVSLAARDGEQRGERRTMGWFAGALGIAGGGLVSFFTHLFGSAK